MPPTGAKPFPPSKRIRGLDSEARGKTRWEDGSLSEKPTHGVGGGVTSKKKPADMAASMKRMLRRKG